jgi:hypothetical protein
MRISHEVIYQALYVQGRGALRRELAACLRTGRTLRVPRARARQRATGHVTPEVMISQRPAEVDDRAVPGHWEGDLIIGADRSAIGTLVEHTTRFTLLLHLPRMAGYGVEPRVKNGPALVGYGAEAMREVIAARIGTLPAQLRRTSPIRTALGSEARTRTRMVCCGSTSPRAPTCRDGPLTTSRPSPRRSTTGPARHWDGRLLPKP